MAVVGPLALDRFRIAEQLGSGAFGTVYRAWDERLRRPVAIKVIPLGTAAGGGGRDHAGQGADERVLREAQAAARLSHHGVVALYEMGTEDGVAYLVTELVEGRSLREVLAEGELDDRQAAELGADLCEALDHAHARGVVHRDLKPANVMVAEPDGNAKLMDFGVASLSDEAGLTATGDVIGTLAYMAPEQAEGFAAGPQADIYALCLVLYECFTGENPNRRRTPAETVRAIGSGLAPIAEQRPDLPAPLADAVDAGLDPEPEFRPSLEELGNALEDAIPHLSPDPPGYRRRNRRLWPATGFGAGLPSRARGDRPVGAGPLRAHRALVLLPLAAPLFGLAGLAAVYPAVAGLARGWRGRVALALTGLTVLALTQVATGRDLGLGSPAAAPPDWQSSGLAGAAQLAEAALAHTSLLATAAVWIAAALIVGLILAPVRAWQGGGGFLRRMNAGSR